MSFYVTVRFKADATKAHDILRQHPDLREAILEGIYKHGLTRCTRLIADGEFLDIDEWPSEKERDAFNASAGEQLGRWRELMGNPEVETHTWTSAPEEGSF